MTLPGSSLPKSPFYELIHVDKWVHITMFGILVFLFLQAIRRFGKTSWQNGLVFIPLAGIAYGIIMEFVQKYWTRDRSFDVWDIVADSVGCILAFVFVRWQVKKKQASPA